MLKEKKASLLVDVIGVPTTSRVLLNDIRDLTKLRRRRQRQRQKEIIVLVSKTTTLHVHDAFLCISLPPINEPLRREMTKF